jgi:hypothetical protein
MRKPRLNFTIGADPEITVLHKNKQLNACDAFSSMRGQQIAGGFFGYDGYSFELRPLPGKTPEELSKNITLMFSDIPRLFDEDITITTQSEYASLGGHVHISVNDFSRSTKKAALVGVVMALPLLNLTSGLTKKQRVDYGHLGDVRFDEVAEGVKTMELRFLPAEWLTTEKSTLSVLSYLTCVFDEAFRKKNLYNEYLKFCGTLDPRLLTKLSMDSFFIQSLTKKIKKDIRGFRLYKHYGSHIKRVFNGSILAENTRFKFNPINGKRLPKSKEPYDVMEWQLIKVKDLDIVDQEWDDDSCDDSCDCSGCTGLCSNCCEWVSEVA